MRLNISHTTEYSYDAPVEYGLQRLRLTPQLRNGQSVIAWQTQLEGAVEEVFYNDLHNNRTELISLIPGTRSIRISSSGEVDTQNLAGVVGPHTYFTPLWLFLRDTPLTARTPAIISLAGEIDEADDIARMHQLMKIIAERVSYQSGTTDATSTAGEALVAGFGVCQDHAHIFISATRILGLPARYVSGFLLMEGQTSQAASHAWAEVYIDTLGWVGFDVSNAISPDDRYVCVATGLDYREAAPISGIRHGFASESLAVQVIVEQ